MNATFCWEESFMDDVCALTENGVHLGYVKPVGGSWQVFHGTELIAFRPDKSSAQNLLSKFVIASREKTT